MAGDTYRGDVDNLRLEVREFAWAMEQKLRKHDHDRGDSWKTMTPTEVTFFLNAEIQELNEAIDRFRSDPSEGTYAMLESEIADVGNGLNFARYNARRWLKDQDDGVGAS